MVKMTTSNSTTRQDRNISEGVAGEGIPKAATTPVSAKPGISPYAPTTTSPHVDVRPGSIHDGVPTTVVSAMKSVERENKSSCAQTSVALRPEIGGGDQLRPQSEVSTATSNPSVSIACDTEDGDSMDEYIRSPHGQNVIAERSPGGRYVRFNEKLGSGASKDVYRAYDTQEGIEVAWNVVNLSGVPKTERNRIVNEVRLLERLHHQNIISFHGSWVNRERQEVNFVTEILSSGTLKSFINKVQVIRWKIAKRWAVQILKGLEYLHSQDPPVIHRDLKCENIFINGTSGDLRIGDLGLSTVHRNGKVLSVLGTPEFMAPDMYEENSYDVKVDIYAFGMCLLEIFTKEIPYKECSNPAQIYKKVSGGDPPESLSRLRSRKAREFIEMCLGYKDENGNYIRPTAEELLSHDFLLKRPNDDDEVEVDRPLQERTIREASTESIAPACPNMPSTSKSMKSLGLSTPTVSAPAVPSSTLEVGSKRADAAEEDESDRFNEMPDSEVNIRKVKVMMGRGEVLKDDEEPLVKIKDVVADQKPQMAEFPPEQKFAGTSAARMGNPRGSDNLVGTLQVQPLLHYLVAAAVIENEPTNSRPYADDILKLVVTLPVEGQTQNVQFDFHLVEDDPVKVAKEMVAELGIPQEAVLEISETISGLACTARMKQDKYLGRSQNSNGMMLATKHTSMQHSLGRGPLQAGTHEIQQGMVMQQQQQIGQAGDFQGMMQSGSRLPMGDYVNAQQHIQQHAQHAQQPINSQRMPGVQENHRAVHASLPMQSQHLSHSEYTLGQHSELQGRVASSGYGHVRQLNAHRQHVGGQPGSEYQGQSELQPQNAPISYGQGVRHPGQVNSQLVRREYIGNHATSEVPPPTPLGSYVRSSQVRTQPQITSDYHSNPGSPEVQTHHPSSSYTHPHGQRHLQPQHISNEYQSHPVGVEGQALSTPASYGQPGMTHGLPEAHTSFRQGVAESQSQAHHHRQPTSASFASHSGHGKGDKHSQLPEGQSIVRPSSFHFPTPVSKLHQNQQMTAPQVALKAPQTSAHPPNAFRSGTTKHNQNQPRSKPYVHAGGAQQQQVPNQMQQMPEHATTSKLLSRPVAPLEAGTRGPGALNADAISMAVSGNRSTASSSGGQGGQQSGNNGVLEDPIAHGMNFGNDPLMLAELRKLDEDFKKNMLRAKKVFDNRMDNLQRTQHQREAQHQKTLEKHQKERAEFEKRIQQEEIEQNRRIEQLQREWDRRREAVRQKQLSDPSADGNSLESNPSEQPVRPSNTVDGSGRAEP